MTSDPDSPGAAGRALVRSLDRGSLATALGEDGFPYVSLVLTACAPDGSPLLLISDLAEHTRNVVNDARAALLFDGTAGLDSPLTGPRITLLGECVRDDDPRLLARFVARHTDASLYAGFEDFHLFRMTVARGHLVAGFGAIHWIDGAELRLDVSDAAALAEAEPDIVEHMNLDHAGAVEACATGLLGRPAGPWRMTGVDPEGCDLRLGGNVARLPFEKRVRDAAGARRALAALSRAAQRGRPEKG